MTNNIDYISELVLDAKTGLYDMYITTFNGSVNVLNIKPFFCTRNHECRLDLVSNDIYNDTKYVGALTSINNILNPFSIRDGDIIFYLPVNDMENLKKINVNLNQAMSGVKNDLINILKKKKPDGLRLNYLNNRPDTALPPTILPDNSPAIVVENNKIKIAPNLFQSPKIKQEAISSNDTTLPISSTDDEVTRILISRYVKSANG